MALLKAEAEKLSLPMLQEGVIDNIVTSDAVFSLIPFMPISGKQYEYNREKTLGDAEYYDVSDALGESAATFDKVVTDLKRLIGQVDVDEFLEGTMSDETDQAATQIQKKSKVVGRKYANSFINGNSAVRAKEFDGLRVLIDGGLASQIDDANDAGLSYDHLDWLIDQVKVAVEGAAFVMNSRTLRGFMKLQRALGGTLPDTLTIDGRTFHQYRGRPILKNDWMPIDETVEGFSRADAPAWTAATVYALGDHVVATSGLATLVFKCTTAGTSHATTEPTWDTTVGNTTNDESPLVWTTMDATLARIILAGMDEDEGVSGLVARSDAGVKVITVGTLEDKDSVRYRVRWYCGMALKSELSVAQVRGINN